MITRREFLQASVAASAIVGLSGFGNWAKLAAQQALTQDQLLQFDDFGNVTLIHVTDIHAQLRPVWFREPAINLGVGDALGKPPHVTGADFLKMFNLTPGSPEAYALTHEDFVALGKGYGKMGGMDRVATVVINRPEARNALNREVREALPQHLAAADVFEPHLLRFARRQRAAS